MLILHAENYRRMPWKNGGGETVEIAIFPQGASIDDFEWRISMATVASDGPFSVFAGVDRTLSILEGEGILLDIDGQELMTLTPTSEPLAFPADAKTDARLLNGKITDLNVMTRRGRFRHRVERHAVDQRTELEIGEGMLFSASEVLRVSVGEAVRELGLHDAAVFDGPQAIVRVEGSGRFFVIRLEKP